MTLQRKLEQRMYRLHPIYHRLALQDRLACIKIKCQTRLGTYKVYLCHERI